MFECSGWLLSLIPLPPRRPRRPRPPLPPPKAYSDLAAACMRASLAQRPTFSQLVEALQGLLDRQDELQAEADAAAAAAYAANA